MPLKEILKSFISVARFVSKLVLLLAFAYIVYYLFYGSAEAGIAGPLSQIVEGFQIVRGMFQFMASTILIMAAGFMVMFQKFRWALILFAAAMLFIFLSAISKYDHNGIKPSNQKFQSPTQI